MAFVVAKSVGSVAALRGGGGGVALSSSSRRGAACRPSRGLVVRPRAEVLWSLAPSPKSAEMAVGVFLDSSYPVQITELINKKRPGPNKTGTIRIGMDAASADISVNLQGVGSIHVEIEEEGDTGHLFISDLGSESGTFVNGQRIDSKVKIRPGDVLSFGPNEPKFLMTRNIVAHA